MANISIRDMIHYDLASMTGEFAAVLGVKLHELTFEQRHIIDEVAFKYAGRAAEIVSEHL